MALVEKVMVGEVELSIFDESEKGSHPKKTGYDLFFPDSSILSLTMAGGIVIEARHYINDYDPEGTALDRQSAEALLGARLPFDWVMGGELVSHYDQMLKKECLGMILGGYFPKN